MTSIGRIEVFPEHDKKGAPTGQWCYRQIGPNGEPLVVSEAFTRRWSAKRGARRYLALTAALAQQQTKHDYHPDLFAPAIWVVDE